MEIYKFKYKDKYFALDLIKLTLMEIDKLAYSVMDYYGDKNDNEIVALLSDKYNEQDVKETIDEIHKIDSTNDSPQEDPKPFSRDINSIHLFINSSCNLQCRYCYIFPGKDSTQLYKTIDEATGKKAIDFILSNSPQSEGCILYFFGGEPLLNFDLIRKLTEYCLERSKTYKKNITFKISTNGTLITAEIANFLKEYNFTVVISIDGPKEIQDKMRPMVSGEGSYDLLAQNIGLLVNTLNPSNLIGRVTLTSYEQNLVTLFDHLISLGIKIIEIAPVSGNDTLPFMLKHEHIKTLKNNISYFVEHYIRLIKGGKYAFFTPFVKMMRAFNSGVKSYYYCSAGKNYLAISPDGNLYPCHKFLSKQDFIMGNIEDGVFPEFRDKYFLLHVESIKKCNKCWARYLCGGGCFFQAYEKNRDMNKPDDFSCKFFQEMTRASIYLYSCLNEQELNSILGMEAPINDTSIEYTYTKNW